MDDPPPPPYSIHDPHSASPASPSHPPQHITAFNASVGDELPIHSGSLRRPSGRVPNAISAEELDKAGFVSAEPYFELRTPAQDRPCNTFYHYIVIGPDACPANLPFPQAVETWTSRGVDNQDWMTFLNHLFPPHSAEKHNTGTQEFEADADLGVGGFHLSNSKSRDQSRPLLGGNRPGSSTGGRGREVERLRRVRVEAVSAQWNEGFFGPRGLEVVTDISNFITTTSVITTPRRSSSNVLQKRPPLEMKETLLHQAVGKGKKSQVRELLDKGGEDIEALSKKGETALYRAISRGEKDIVQLLLENGADPTARPSGAESPLHSLHSFFISFYHQSSVPLVKSKPLSLELLYFSI